MWYEITHLFPNLNGFNWHVKFNAGVLFAFSMTVLATKCKAETSGGGGGGGGGGGHQWGSQCLTVPGFSPSHNWNLAIESLFKKTMLAIVSNQYYPINCLKSSLTSLRNRRMGVNTYGGAVVVAVCVWCVCVCVCGRGGGGGLEYHM